MSVFRQRVFFLLILILLLSIFLRLFKLAEIPPAFDWDEASNFYNAYSIFKTGKDEFNQKLPILFRAFDGYVPPVLIYLNVVSILFFGFSEISVRLPNVFLGVLATVGLYTLIYQISKKQKSALISSLFLAVSPISVIYSRVNTFPSAPTAFLIFATVFFIAGLKNNRYMFLSILLFIGAIFSYYSAYVFVPLFFISLLIFYRKKLSFSKAIILVIPVFLTVYFIFFVLPGGNTRYKGVSSLNDPDLIKENAFFAQNENVTGKIFHNRRITYAQKILEGYFSPLQFSFLFSKTDTAARMVVPGSGFGLLYWFDFPFLLMGLYFLVKRKTRGMFFIISWLFLSLIPNAPTLPQTSSTRITIIIPAFIILIAYGFFEYIQGKGKLLKTLLVILFTINCSFFIHNYFIHYPVIRASSWFWEYKPLFSFLSSPENKQRKVFFVFSQPSFLDQVHIFTAFYNKIDPQEYQEKGGTRLGRFGTTGEFSIGRFVFIPDYCKICAKNITQEKEDFVITNKKIYVTPLKIISSLNNQETLFIYKVKEAPVELILSF